MIHWTYNALHQTSRVGNRESGREGLTMAGRCRNSLPFFPTGIVEDNTVPMHMEQQK